MTKAELREKIAEIIINLDCDGDWNLAYKQTDEILEAFRTITLGQLLSNKDE